MAYEPLNATDPSITQPIGFRPEIQHIRGGLFGRDTLAMVRGWLSYLDVQLTSRIALSAKLGNYQHYAHNRCEHEETEFVKRLVLSNAFKENGVLPSQLLGEYISAIYRLCSRDKKQDSDESSIIEAISGYETLSRRVNDGILVAEAKLRIPEVKSNLLTAIIAKDKSRLKELLRNTEQEKSVISRAIRSAFILKLSDEEVFIPLYEEIMHATLEKEVNYLIDLRDELI
jgi:hypothetical protein